MTVINNLCKFLFAAGLIFSLNVKAMPPYINDAPFNLHVVDSADNEMSTPMDTPARAFFENAKPWPEGKVFYKIQDTYKPIAKKKIMDGINAIQKATCIRFYPKTKDTKNYISFEEKYYGQSGCFAFGDEGFEGGKQLIVLSYDACSSEANAKLTFAGAAVHEIMHTLGFGHEFQRADREKYITYHPENVLEAIRDTEYAENNFDVKKKDIIPKGVPFNFRSIMQYAPTHLAESPDKPTFTEVKPLAKETPEPLGEYKNMGQFCRISAGDRNSVNIIYQKECKLKTVPVYTEGIQIENTDCKLKLDPILNVDEPNSK